MSGAAPRIAIVGFGNIAAKHVEVFRVLGAEIAGSCNRSVEGRARAEAAGISRTFSDVDAMVAATEPDAILCCASIHENFAAASQVLKFGLPVLLEKPPGIYPHELESLIAQRAPVMLALNRLHYSVLERAIEDAGTITGVHVEWSEDPAHLLKRGFKHAQVLRRNASNSVHGISLMTHLAGELADFSMSVDVIEKPYRLQMTVHGRSTRGIACSFRSSWDAPVRWRLQLLARGRVYDFAPLEECAVRDPSAKTIEPSAADKQYKPGFYRQAERFLEVMRTRVVPEAYTLEAFRPAMRIADALSAEIERINLEVSA